MATTRQKLAIAKVVENGGNISKAMREVGFSAATASTPSKLTNSIGWQELMQKYFPDEDLSKLHKKFLNKKEVISVSDGYNAGSHIEFTGQPHSDALKALETAYKLKGRYTEVATTNNNVQINILNYEKGNNDPVQVRAESIPTDSAASN